jgi:hypothetical protein
VSGGPISYLGKLRRYSGVQNRSRCGLWPQGERTPHQQCWSLRIGSRGKVSPRDHRIWKMCTGIKIPFGMAQECGDRDTRTPKNPKI